MLFCPRKDVGEFLRLIVEAARTVVVADGLLILCDGS